MVGCFGDGGDKAAAGVQGDAGFGFVVDGTVPSVDGADGVDAVAAGCQAVFYEAAVKAASQSASGAVMMTSQISSLMPAPRVAARIILTEHGAPGAAIISVEELGELQAAVDAADITVAAEVKASAQAGIPHDQVMAALDALDASDQANSAAQAEVILAPHSPVLARADVEES